MTWGTSSDDLLPVTIADMAAEVRRELILREAVYPGLIARKKLTPSRADRQIAVMKAVLAHLEGQLR